MSTRLGDHAARAGLDLAYLAIGLATSIIAFCVWVTAVSVTLSLLIFVVGLPLFLLSAIAFRWTAELDRRNAALVVGQPLRGSYRDHRGEGFFERLSSTASDLQTWKDLLWLVLHSGLGFALGCAAAIIAGAWAALLTMPAWYWAIDGGVDIGIWHVDTIGKALLCTVAALPLAALAAALLRLMAFAESWLARALLEGVERRPALPAALAPRRSCRACRGPRCRWPPTPPSRRRWRRSCWLSGRRPAAVTSGPPGSGSGWRSHSASTAACARRCGRRPSSGRWPCRRRSRRCWSRWRWRSGRWPGPAPSGRSGSCSALPSASPCTAWRCCSGAASSPIAASAS